MQVTNGEGFSSYSKGGISVHLFSDTSVQHNMETTANWINSQKLSAT